MGALVVFAEGRLHSMEPRERALALEVLGAARQRLAARAGNLARFSAGADARDLERLFAVAAALNADDA